MFTGISFAYFGGKRKEEGEEEEFTQRTQRKATQDHRQEYPCHIYLFVEVSAYVFYLGEDSEGVFAEDFADVGFGVALF
jgi:hypothetical protein